LHPLKLIDDSHSDWCEFRGQVTREDECVELTTEATRIRKLELDANPRVRAASARKHAGKG